MIYCAASQTLAKNEFLARIVEDHMGIAPLPSILRLPLGKPYLAGHEGVGLSYSHSGDVLFAAAGRCAVGADVEQIRPRREGLARYIMSDEEYRWFLARGRQWTDFYRLWTLKEARVKCTGEGLRKPPRTIGVPLLSEGQAIFEGFTFRTYQFGTCCAAVCAEGRKQLPEHIHIHEKRKED